VRTVCIEDENVLSESNQQLRVQLGAPDHPLSVVGVTVNSHGTTLQVKVADHYSQKFLRRLERAVEEEAARGSSRPSCPVILAPCQLQVELTAQTKIFDARGKPHAAGPPLISDVKESDHIVCGVYWRVVYTPDGKYSAFCWTLADQIAITNPPKRPTQERLDFPQGGDSQAAKKKDRDSLSAEAAMRRYERRKQFHMDHTWVQDGGGGEDSGGDILAAKEDHHEYSRLDLSARYSAPTHHGKQKMIKEDDDEEQGNLFESGSVSADGSRDATDASVSQ